MQANTRKTLFVIGGALVGVIVLLAIKPLFHFPIKGSVLIDNHKAPVGRHTEPFDAIEVPYIIARNIGDGSLSTWQMDGTQTVLEYPDLVGGARKNGGLRRETDLDTTTGDLVFYEYSTSDWKNGNLYYHDRSRGTTVELDVDPGYAQGTAQQLHNGYLTFAGTRGDENFYAFYDTRTSSWENENIWARMKDGLMELRIATEGQVYQVVLDNRGGRKVGPVSSWVLFFPAYFPTEARSVDVHVRSIGYVNEHYWAWGKDNGHQYIQYALYTNQDLFDRYYASSNQPAWPQGTIDPAITLEARNTRYANKPLPTKDVFTLGEFYKLDSLTYGMQIGNGLLVINLEDSSAEFVEDEEHVLSLLNESTYTLTPKWLKRFLESSWENNQYDIMRRNNLRYPCNAIQYKGHENNWKIGTLVDCINY